LGLRVDVMFLCDIGDELVADVVACLSKLYINDFPHLYLYNYIISSCLAIKCKEANMRVMDKYR